jgi:adenine phosphoribosyltransferase
LNLSEALSHIREIPDYPKPGIVFKDITPLLSNGKAFDVVIDALCEGLTQVDIVAGIEARGFILASAMATKLGAGFVPLRKAGKLPHHVFTQSYELEYGNAQLEIHQNAFPVGAKVVLVDDVLATGGTLAAATKLISEVGGVLTRISVLLEISFLNGRSKILADWPDVSVKALLSS